MVEFPTSAPPRFFYDRPARCRRGSRTPRACRAARCRAAASHRRFHRVVQRWGGEYACTLSRAGRNSMRARVVAWRDVERESGLDHHPRARTGQAGTGWITRCRRRRSFGVHAIRPLTTERSVVRLSDERADRRLVHWRNIVAAGLRAVRAEPPARGSPVATLGAFLAGCRQRRRKRLLLAPTGSARLAVTSPCGKDRSAGRPRGRIDRGRGRTRRARRFCARADRAAGAAHRDGAARRDRGAAVDAAAMADRA